MQLNYEKEPEQAEIETTEGEASGELEGMVDEIKKKRTSKAVN